MFDREAAALLELINAESPDGAFKILGREDLLSRMPKRCACDGESLGRAMTLLAGEELVLLKYADEKSFCVASCPKGRAHGQPERGAVAGTRGNRLLSILAIALGAAGVVLGVLGIVL